ncbi:hypothetical protein Krac_10156 [Ktedonobacter racemifer DSM 44963]|uniref:Uncharacterized protein n=1 Tax=Ktedonobacter racemifer DSM 44963 TaxID=485913 RepID=D6TFJ2_KTERA|nr:hypothetical protein Krac_10156 [Ktedonobacter racemifer DSM 44963]
MGKRPRLVLIRSGPWMLPHAEISCGIHGFFFLSKTTDF